MVWARFLLRHTVQVTDRVARARRGSQHTGAFGFDSFSVRPALQ